MDGNAADRDCQSKSAGRIPTMLKGRAEQGYNHGRYAVVFYRGLALDPAYVDGFVEGCLHRVVKDRPDGAKAPTLHACSGF